MATRVNNNTWLQLFWMRCLQPQAWCAIALCPHPAVLLRSQRLEGTCTFVYQSSVTFAAAVRGASADCGALTTALNQALASSGAASQVSTHVRMHARTYAPPCVMHATGD